MRRNKKSDKSTLFREKKNLEFTRDEILKSREELLNVRDDLAGNNNMLQVRNDAIEETLADIENDNQHKAKEITQW